MFWLMRIFRGVCGVLFAMQVIHVIEAILWISKIEVAELEMGGFYLLLSFKIIVLGVSGFLFFWLRDFINALHTKRYGRPHPTLAKNKWAL